MYNSHSVRHPKFQGSLSSDIPPGFQSHSLRLEPALLHRLDLFASASGSFPVFESSHLLASTAQVYRRISRLQNQLNVLGLETHY